MHPATPQEMTRKPPPADPLLSTIPEIITILVVIPKLQPAAHYPGWLRRPQLVAAQSKAVWRLAKDTLTLVLVSKLSPILFIIGANERFHTQNCRFTAQIL